MAFALEFPPELVDAIADAVAARLAEQANPQAASPYLTVDEAAQYIRASGKQRVYDLISQGVLEPRRDGRRVLLDRRTLDDYLSGEASA